MLAYVLGSTIFAAVCSCVVLAMGGTFQIALLVYLLSGQIAVLSLIGLIAHRNLANSRETS